MKIDKKQVFNILKKITLSIGDQGLYSLSNFLLNIFLVRWLSLESYGLFAFGFSVFLFLSGFHNALILEPISVLATGNHKDHLWAYLRIQIKLNFLVMISLGLICIIGAGFVSIYSDQFANSLLLAGLSAPFLLSYWFFRRLCYIESSPFIAVIGSVLYSIILLISIYLANILNILSPSLAFFLMSISSLISSLFVWRLLIQRTRRDDKQEELNLLDIIREQWNYSKWVVGVAFFYWANTGLAILLVGVFLGVEQSGVYKGLQNLILPLQQIIAALSMLFLPWFSSLEFEDGKQKTSLLLVGSFFLLSIFYCIPFVLLPNQLFNFIYGNSNLNEYSGNLIFFLFIGVLISVTSGLSLVLRAIKFPEAIFFANLFSAVYSITINVYLIYKLGMVGAILGMVASTVIVLVFEFIFYMRWLKNKRLVSFSKGKGII